MLITFRNGLPIVMFLFCRLIVRVPRSTQEAMAIGRAIITTDVPGCRETVVNGLNGFIVPKWNAEELAKKMIYF
jgi:glycosyltransferase involved in cell wall biosynthesis